MKIFALLAAFISFSSYSAVIDGCFKTLSFNGAPVIEGPVAEKNLSHIYSVTSRFYFDQSQTPLKTKVISIYKGFDSGWYTTINPIIFDDLGDVAETENSWSYSYQGIVRYAFSRYTYGEADFVTDAHFAWGEDGLLYGKVFQQTKALDRDIRFDVVLEKAPCPID